MPAYVFKSSLQGRGLVGQKSHKRKSSDASSGPPVKKANTKMGPTNQKQESVDQVKPPSAENDAVDKEDYVEVTTLEKLQSVENILLDLRDRKYS